MIGGEHHDGVGVEVQGFQFVVQRREQPVGAIQLAVVQSANGFLIFLGNKVDRSPNADPVVAHVFDPLARSFIGDHLIFKKLIFDPARGIVGEVGVEDVIPKEER